MPTAEDQLRIEKRQKQRAIHTRNTRARRLKEIGAEFALPHGRALFDQQAVVVGMTVNRLMAGYIENPKKAGPHHNALPLLVMFRDPRQVAAIALRVVVDRLSQRQTFATACQRIGWALECELRAMKLERASRLAFMRLLRQVPKRQDAVKDRVMDLFRCPTKRWPNRARFELGALLLDAIASETDLLEVYLVRRGRHQQRMVGPSPWAIEAMGRYRPPQIHLVRQVMVVPPKPWTGLYGGGHLTDSERPLVKMPVQHVNDPDDSASAYLEEAIEDGRLRTTLEVVNALQAEPLRLDQGMLALQREAWDKGIHGLFPCARAPLPVPEKLSQDASPAQWKTRNVLAYRAHRDRRDNGPKRIHVERSLQLAEELPAGVPIYQAWMVDFRGRLYTSNRYLSHQAGDMERALLSFERSAPIDDRGREWILMQAASQDGCGRLPWEERLAYGIERLPLWVRVGRDPFALLEHWRGAKEPWQLLQSCRALAALEDGAADCGIPIRLDQTTSGCAHFAAMWGDRRLARITNLTGNTPQDLYAQVAEQVTQRLEELLHTAEGGDRMLAEFWLKVGVTRKWTKPIVLAAPYGGSYMRNQELLIDLLEQHQGVVDPAEFRRRIAWPAVFLARLLWEEMKRTIEPVLDGGHWLRRLARACAQKQQPVRLTGPTSFPLVVAERESTKEKVDLALFGRARFQGLSEEEIAPVHRITTTIAEQRPGNRLSGRMMSAAMPANYVHMLDGGLAQRVVQAAHTVGMPMLPTHDCFATIPSRAQELHTLLHCELRRLHQTDWLALSRREIAAAVGEVGLPKLPRPEGHQVREIGGNPYAFC